VTGTAEDANDAGDPAAAEDSQQADEVDMVTYPVDGS
jgi:hypothetical protein